VVLPKMAQQDIGVEKWDVSHLCPHAVYNFFGDGLFSCLALLLSRGHRKLTPEYPSGARDHAFRAYNPDTLLVLNKGHKVTFFQPQPTPDRGRQRNLTLPRDGG
jgi:hypothetical protein